MSQGLTPKDHGFLNGLALQTVEERRRIYAAKRQEYANDPVALQQIDVYDGESEYSRKIGEYRDAWLEKNEQRIAELDAWFQTNFPAIRQKEA